MRRAAYIEAALIALDEVTVVADSCPPRLRERGIPAETAMNILTTGQRREREMADRRREWGKEIRQKRKQGKL